MNRETFVASTPCLEQKWQRQNKQWHKYQVATAKSTINKYINTEKSQLTRYILNSNSKKTKMQNEKNEKIDKDNLMLV